MAKPKKKAVHKIDPRTEGGEGLPRAYCGVNIFKSGIRVHAWLEPTPADCKACLRAEEAACRSKMG